jgi:uncharacterized protein (DUF2141 family)
MFVIKVILFAFWMPQIVELKQSETESVKLVVEIDNIRHTNGQVMRIAIDKQEGFLKDPKPFQYVILPVNSAKLSYTFELPKGEYAVSVYHDLNANEILDKNIFGAPKEPYGFSKNFKPFMSAPKFDDVKIILNQDRKINISLIYP